jgi:c-di-GMP-binding flagellar brake protein YcgR
MAVKIKVKSVDPQRRKSKRTSIGSSLNTYPRNKNAKNQYKKYRGQGR